MHGNSSKDVEKSYLLSYTDFMALKNKQKRACEGSN